VIAPPLTAAAAQQAAAVDTRAVLAALAAASGNVGAAAVTLKIARRTLDRRINALGLRDWLSTAYPRSARQPRSMLTTPPNRRGAQ
jgi:DNA-binding NtrC family response regulator